MLLSSLFTRSMVFAYFPKAQLPLFPFRAYVTIRQNSLHVTVCMIACSLSGYFIHSLSTLYYYSAPSLATQLTGDYCDRTHTGKYGPAWLDTRKDVKEWDTAKDNFKAEDSPAAQASALKLTPHPILLSLSNRLLQVTAAISLPDAKGASKGRFSAYIRSEGLPHKS